VRARWSAVVVALILALLAPVAVSTQSAKEEYERLEEINDKLQETIDWLFWALDTMGAIRANEPLPAVTVPWPASELEQVLVKNREEVRKIAAPTFAAPLPSVGTLPTSSHDVRPYLRVRIEALLTTGDEMVDSLQSRPMLLALAKQANTAARLVRSVSTVLEDLMKAGFDISGQITYLWFNNEATYRPLLNQIEEAAGAKATAVANAVNARAAGVRTAGAQIQSALAVEDAALAAEAARLDTVAAELRERLARLDADEAALNALARDIRQTEDAIADVISDSRRLRGERSNVSRRKAQLEERIRTLDRELNTPYNRCPNGKSYDQCDHQELKRAWDADQQQRRRERTATSNEVTQLNDEIRRIDGELTDNDARQGRLQRDLEGSRAQHQRDALALEAGRRQYAEDQAAALWDLWRSRATLYRDENHRDAAAVTRLLQSLPTP
jgi:hypothetical protein